MKEKSLLNDILIIKNRLPFELFLDYAMCTLRFEKGTARVGQDTLGGAWGAA